MDRRSFIKSVIALAGMAAVPAYAVKSGEIEESIFFDGEDAYKKALIENWESFNPEKKYGNTVLLSPDFGKEHLSIVIEALDRNIYECVPEKYRNKIEYMFADYGKTEIIDFFDGIRSISWKYSPRHKERSREVTKAAINAIF